jgi:transposase InsO family protein
VTKIVTQFGAPKNLLTDRGANFTSALIEKMCKLLKFKKLQKSSYHPQANGVCERMHKLLIDMLSHFVWKDAKNWDEYVPYAVMAYRAALPNIPLTIQCLEEICDFLLKMIGSRG